MARLALTSLLLSVLVTGLAACRERVVPCKSEYDCLEKEVCIDGECRATCNTSRDCQPGEVCLGGACRQATDASLPDAQASDRSDGGGSDLRPTDAGTPSDQFWSAWCRRLLRCAPSWGQTVADVPTCESLMRQRIECQTWYAIEDPTAVPGCVAWLDQVSCDVTSTWSNPDCWRAIFGGIAALGESCQDYSCETGLYCHWTTTEGICPVCRHPPATGQACGIIDNTYVQCGSDDYCTSWDGGLCADKLGNGASCSGDEQCVSGFCRLGSCASTLQRDQPCGEDDRCYMGLVCRGGRCTDPGGSGVACTDYNGCQMTHVCHRGICTAADPCQPARVGEACTYSAGCVTGTWCNSDTTINECIADTPVSSICSDWRECGNDADCIEVNEVKRCVARAGLGQLCDVAYCNLDTYCDYNAQPQVCKAYKPNGVDCDSDWECESYYCTPTSQICADEPPCTMP
ncbi:MAG: hypothetical protein JXR83_23310 [Deltaproteobacteria bacterium]|nr:hypothetical protein [Deltaproteobacteria bacterium]